MSLAPLEARQAAYNTAPGRVVVPPVTDLCTFLGGGYSVAAFLQLELLWIYIGGYSFDFSRAITI
ncbi:hypothetical protein A4U42_00870 [Dickeya solani IPO 2222]|nr:hypothetical protein A4U42_00870 [Dickeya solani IPO 2222]